MLTVPQAQTGNWSGWGAFDRQQVQCWTSGPPGSISSPRGATGVQCQRATPGAQRQCGRWACSHVAERGGWLNAAPSASQLGLDRESKDHRKRLCKKALEGDGKFSSHVFFHSQIYWKLGGLLILSLSLPKWQHDWHTVINGIQILSPLLPKLQYSIGTFKCIS